MAADKKDETISCSRRRIENLYEEYFYAPFEIFERSSRDRAALIKKEK